MLHLLQDNVRQDLIKFVPTYLHEEITCFAFYDDHPRDDKAIEVIICSKYGEIMEYFQRSFLCSLHLGEGFFPKEIRILRNTKCELFYLVASDDKIKILSRKDDIQIHKTVTNVESYKFDDVDFKGQGSLKIYCKDDAVPLVFDDNFNVVENQVPAVSIGAVVSSPLLLNLQRKYIEAKYSVMCNKKVYTDLISFRQNTAYYSSTETCSSSADSLFKPDVGEGTGGLTLRNKKPWIKMCNGKCVLLLTVENNSNCQIKDISVIHDSPTKDCVVYTVKVYNKCTEPPYWKLIESQSLDPKLEATVVVVIDIEQLKDNISSHIIFEGVVSYKMEERTIFVPFEPVTISAAYTMGEEFDVLFNINIDVNNTMLAILSTTQLTNLVLRFIMQEDDDVPSVLDLFCQYLNMEKLLDSGHIVVHRNSPYHILNGVMVVNVEDYNNLFGDVNHVRKILVYSRTPSQVLALIHYMYDALPHNIIASLPQHKVIAKFEDLSKYTEDTTNIDHLEVNHKEYANNLAEQCTIILEYLDKCIVGMNKSKNLATLEKVGTVIDLFAIDVASFLEFRNSLLALSEKSCDIKFNREPSQNLEEIVLSD